MKKLVLITTSLFIINTAYSQEQQAENIQQNKITTTLKLGHPENENTSRHVSSKTANTNYPITYTVDRNGKQRVVKAEKKPEDFKEKTIKTVTRQLKELYGPYYGEYGPQSIVSSATFYEQCEFIPLSMAPPGIKNISSLNVKEKYNPEVIYHDNLTTFNAETFNVLKYQFNYYKKSVQYYRIYNSDTVLKIKKYKDQN